MATTLLRPTTDLPQTQDLARPPVSTRVLTAGWIAALVVVAVVNLPAFLTTALECDPIMFDLLIRDAKAGRVLYRDMVENKPPGMIVVQAGVRSVVGPSTEAIRVIDLVVVGSALALLAGYLNRGRSTLMAMTLFLLSVFYLSTLEWNHVQADVWALLPVMLTLRLRRTRLAQMTTGTPASPVLATALLEGAIWGLVVWMKPHIAFVGIVVWLVGTAWALRHGTRPALLVADAGGMILGGAIVGLVGIGLMMFAGIWQPFVNHMTTWATDYPGSEEVYRPHNRWFTRVGLLMRMFPWSLAFLLPIPLAIGACLHGLRRPSSTSSFDDRNLSRTLLAAAFLGWSIQGWFLQHIFDYPQIGALILGLALLVYGADRLRTVGLHRIAFGLLGLLVIAGHASLFRERVREWWPSIQEGSTAARKDRFTGFNRIGWQDLEKVAGFLKEQHVTQGEVAAISDTALPLWQMIDLAPSSRYYVPHNNLLGFPHHREAILADLAAVPNQRFLICDIRCLWLTQPERAHPGDPATWPLDPEWYGPRRWADRVVFQAGHYIVVQLNGPELRTWVEEVTDLGPAHIGR